MFWSWTVVRNTGSRVFLCQHVFMQRADFTKSRQTDVSALSSFASESLSCCRQIAQRFLSSQMGIFLLWCFKSMSVLQCEHSGCLSFRNVTTPLYAKTSAHQQPDFSKVSPANNLWLMVDLHCSLDIFSQQIWICDTTLVPFEEKFHQI